jgi:hypothetical protein
MLFLVKNSLVKKEVWDVVLSWCNNQFFCDCMMHHIYEIGLSTVTGTWQFGVRKW